MKRALVLLGMALLSGCTVGPDFAPPAAPSSKGYTPDPPPTAIPATAGLPGETLVAGAALPARWWTQFGNVGLDRLVDMALAANTDIAVADANLRQARAQAATVAGSRLPRPMSSIRRRAFAHPAPCPIRSRTLASSSTACTPRR